MNKYNDLFKKIELFEKLAVYSDRSYFLKSISQQSSDLGYTPVQQEPNKSVDLGYTPVNNQNPSLEQNVKPKYPSINPEVQKQLNYLGNQYSHPLNLKLDGSLGPATRSALDWFKHKFNVIAEMNDKDLYDVIYNSYSRAIADAAANITKGQRPVSGP